MVELKIGDKVSFLDDDNEGVIVNIINKNKIQVEDKYGFLSDINPEKLVLVHDDFYNKTFDEIEQIKKEKIIPDKKKIIHDTKIEIPEIDLHIHNILENTTNMTNYDIVLFQINFAEKKMIAFHKKGYKKIIFIHGKGQGVLKNEIISFFQKKYNAMYQDASYSKYGLGGATLIYIKDIN